MADRKGSSEGGGGHTGRSRERASGRGDETPERGSTVPKFGEWDENNPSTADGFTEVFNKVREEKHSGSSKVPIITDDAMYLNTSQKTDSTGCSCFGWLKK